MHIPDGFLDVKTIAATSAVSFAGIALALRKIKKHISIENIPLMGIITAFLFTIQLLAFPIVGGTSGHLIGVVIAASIIGPFSTIIAMSVSLFMQALIFQHGGLLLFGANFFNLAIMNIGFYMLFKIIFKNEIVIVWLASFFGIISGALACGLELYVSGKIPFQQGIPSLIVSQVPIALIESFAAVIFISSIKKIRPSILELKKV